MLDAWVKVRQMRKMSPDVSEIDSGEKDVSWWHEGEDLDHEEAHDAWHRLRTWRIRRGRSRFCHWKEPLCMQETSFLCSANTGKDNSRVDTSLPVSVALDCIMHPRYFAQINLNLRLWLWFCAKASFSLLLILLGWGAGDCLKWPPDGAWGSHHARVSSEKERVGRWLTSCREFVNSSLSFEESLLSWGDNWTLRQIMCLLLQSLVHLRSVLPPCLPRVRKFQCLSSVN